MLRLVYLLVFLLMPALGNAADRIALVIGNSAYADLPDLRHTTREASDLAIALERQGFAVTTLQNATRRDVRHILARLSEGFGRTAVFALFYAGHAVSERGVPYLLATDAPGDPDALAFNGLSVEGILQEMSNIAEASILVLDAHSPFSDPALSGAARDKDVANGLANLYLPQGTAVLSYAPLSDPLAGTLEIARKDYSPLVRDLIAQLARDGVTVDQIAQSASQQLNAFAADRPPVQYQSAIAHDVALGATAPMAAASPAPRGTASPSPSAGSGGPASGEMELSLFRLAQQSGEPALLSAYLERYPNGRFAPLARAMLADQAGRANAPAKPATMPAPAVAKPKPAAQPKKPTRGWSKAGETPPPQFPWPPPQPSATVLLPLQDIQAAASGQAVGVVMKVVEAALNEQGYHDRSYWSVPGGAALATRLERIDRDGQPITRPTRWPTAKLENDFSLGAYLKSLFFTEPGFFRVIVFVLSTETIAPTDREATSDEALDWLRRGMVTLPKEIAERDVETTHNLTALIYEFEKIADSEAVVLSPGRLTGREHLQSAGLSAMVAGN